MPEKGVRELVFSVVAEEQVEGDEAENGLFRGGRGRGAGFADELRGLDGGTADSGDGREDPELESRQERNASFVFRPLPGNLVGWS